MSFVGSNQQYLYMQSIDSHNTTFRWGDICREEMKNPCSVPQILRYQ